MENEPTSQEPPKGQEPQSPVEEPKKVEEDIPDQGTKKEESPVDKVLRIKSELEETEKRIDEKMKIFAETEEKFAQAIMRGRAAGGDPGETESEKIQKEAKAIVDKYQ